MITNSQEAIDYLLRVFRQKDKPNPKKFQISRDLIFQDENPDTYFQIAGIANRLNMTTDERKRLLSMICEKASHAMFLLAFEGNAEYAKECSLNLSIEERKQVVNAIQKEPGNAGIFLMSTDDPAEIEQCFETVINSSSEEDICLRFTLESIAEKFKQINKPGERAKNLVKFMFEKQYSKAIKYFCQITLKKTNYDINTITYDEYESLLVMNNLAS